MSYLSVFETKFSSFRGINSTWRQPGEQPLTTKNMASTIVDCDGYGFSVTTNIRAPAEVVSRARMLH